MTDHPALIFETQSLVIDKIVISKKIIIDSSISKINWCKLESMGKKPQMTELVTIEDARKEVEIDEDEDIDEPNLRDGYIKLKNQAQKYFIDIQKENKTKQNMP